LGKAANKGVTMATKNDITGDAIRSKSLSKQGRDNWDTIFGKKNTEEAPTEVKINKVINKDNLTLTREDFIE
tara:strand:+ start:1214 stop:1429 length:216 start_codon:yes stop_codon:yes gene_type:complete